MDEAFYQSQTDLLIPLEAATHNLGSVDIYDFLPFGQPFHED